MVRTKAFQYIIWLEVGSQYNEANIRMVNGQDLYSAFLPSQTKRFAICLSFTYSHGGGAAMQGAGLHESEGEEDIKSVNCSAT